MASQTSDSATKRSSPQTLDSFKWIGYTAVGVVVGLTVYHQLMKKFLNRNHQLHDHDVNVIEQNKWKIPVIACKENGDSYITEEYIKLTDKGDIGKLSDEISVKTMRLRTTPGTYNYDWHNAPRRQYIINLDAPVHVTTSDGDEILLKTGQVFKVEDVSGHGHYSRSVNNLPRKSCFIAFD